MENNNRIGLPEQLELISRFFRIEGIAALMAEFKEGLNVMQVNGVVMQVMAIGIKADKPLMDSLVAWHTGMDDEHVQEMKNGEYAKHLRDSITGDVLGFFG